MKPYELLLHTQPEGWRRFALLPGELGWSLVSIIAEEARLAWVLPVRVVRGSELVLELGTTEKAA